MGKTYLCVQGHEEEPLAVPGDADSLDKGVYINAAKDTLLMLDENGKLSYMPLTDSGAEAGAQKIDTSVSDACFWKDSIVYIKRFSDICILSNQRKKKRFFHPSVPLFLTEMKKRRRVF